MYNLYVISNFCPHYELKLNTSVVSLNGSPLVKKKKTKNENKGRENEERFLVKGKVELSACP